MHKHLLGRAFFVIINGKKEKLCRKIKIHSISGIADSWIWRKRWGRGAAVTKRTGTSGAVVVKNKRIMTTGYNGAPAGIESCRDKKTCLRRELNIPSGTRQELCYAVHAEQNAIAQAARMGINIEGATLYCTHQPCIICTKLIINAGIRRVVYKYGYPDELFSSSSPRSGHRAGKDARMGMMPVGDAEHEARDRA